MACCLFCTARTLRLVLRSLWLEEREKKNNVLRCMKISHDTAVTDLSSCTRDRVIHEASNINRAVLLSCPLLKSSLTPAVKYIKIAAAVILEWWCGEGNSELVSGESKTSDVLVALTERCKRQTDDGGCGWGTWFLPLWSGAGYFTSQSLGFLICTVTVFIGCTSEG